MNLVMQRCPATPGAGFATGDLVRRVPGHAADRPRRREVSVFRHVVVAGKPADRDVVLLGENDQLRRGAAGFDLAMGPRRAPEGDRGLLL
jgi:hypothetical protein